MGKFSKRAKIVVAASVAVVALTGGVAFAFWSSSGSGSGTAATASGASNLAVVQTSTLSDLAPGGPTDAITGTITNNGTASAFVNTVTVAIGSVTQDPAASGTCDASDYTLSNPVVTVGQDLAPGAVVAFDTASIAFNDKPDTNQDGCKNATVNLTYTTN